MQLLRLKIHIIAGNLIRIFDKRLINIGFISEKTFIEKTKNLEK